MTIELKGVDRVKRSLERMEAQLPGVVGGALYQEGLAIDALSTERIPTDTSRLKNTHYVTRPQKTRDGLVIEVGVGTDYAIFVHERTELNHPSGQAKFLESAFNERAVGFLRRLAKRVKANLLSGRTFGSGIGSGGAPTRPRDRGAEWQKSQKSKRREKLAKVRDRTKARKQRAANRGKKRKQKKR